MKPATGSGDKQSLRWLFRRSCKATPWIVLSVVLGFSSGLTLIAQAAQLAAIVQGVFIDGRPVGDLLTRFVVLAALITARALLNWCRETVGFAAGARVRAQVRSELMRYVAALGPDFVDRHRIGALASAALEQVEALHGFFAHYLPQTALAVMIPAAIAAFILPLSWAAAGLLVLAAPLIPLFMILVGMGAESIAQSNFQALARLSAHFLDVLQGLATLKLFDRSRSEADRVATASEAYRKETMRVLRVAFLSSAVLEFFSAMGIALVAVYLGMGYLGYLDFGSYGRELRLSDGLFILLLAPDFFLPLRELGTHYHARAEAVGAATEIRTVLSSPLPEKQGSERQVPGPMPIHLEVDRLGFAYDGGRAPALDQISFRLETGEHVALVGASGAGKTTLLKLLLGFVHPTEGEIRNRTIPLRDLVPGDWRRHLAWIGQAPLLFHGSIGDNIRIGDPQASQRRVEMAADAARVSEFSNRLPRGLETPVGEQGFGLSRGQAQRVALARAFLKDAPLLLLDEPTAGLDAGNERLVMAAIRELARERTVLIATHRLEHLERADRILVLDAGRLVEQGSYRELMAGKGRLYQLARPHSEGDAP